MKFLENRLVETRAGWHQALTVGSPCTRALLTRSRGSRSRSCRVLATLLPVLALGRVAVLRRHAEQAVAKLLGRMLEIATERLHHAAAVDQAERGNEAAHFAFGVERDGVAHVQKAGGRGRRRRGGRGRTGALCGRHGLTGSEHVEIVEAAAVYMVHGKASLFRLVSRLCESSECASARGTHEFSLLLQTCFSPIASV